MLKPAADDGVEHGVLALRQRRHLDDVALRRLAVILREFADRRQFETQRRPQPDDGQQIAWRQMIEPIAQRGDRLRPVRRRDGGGDVSSVVMTVSFAARAFDDRCCALMIARRQGNAAVLRCDSPFWNFSLAVYAQPGVAAECLALQNASNIDVNALLFCAWLGADRKIILTDENLAAIDAHVRHWHETVVRSLRAVRQAMKPLPEMADDAVASLRKEIAALELRAEQIEQAVLFEAAARLSQGASVATAKDGVPANVAAFVQRNATSAVKMALPRLLIAAALAYRASPPVKNH